MSSNFGAMAPLMERIQRLRDMGRSAINTLSQPGQMIQHAVQPQQQQSHEQAIQQMNADMNAHKNDAANASFKPNLSTMKKPLGK